MRQYVKKVFKPKTNTPKHSIVRWLEFRIFNEQKMGYLSNVRLKSVTRNGVDTANIYTKFRVAYHLPVAMFL